MRSSSLASLLVLSLACAACSTTALRVDPLGDDAGAPPPLDASEPPPAIDAGLDAAAPPERCFDDVSLVTLRGGRANFSPHALLAHPAGWLAIYDASVHDGISGTFAAFLDRDGRLARTERIEWADPWQHHLVIDRYLVSWGTWGHHTLDVRAIDVDALTVVDDALAPGHVGQIVALDRGDDGIVRVISHLPTPADPMVYDLVYAELVLGDDGRFDARSAPLPSLDALGSDALADAARRYGVLPAPDMTATAQLFVFPSNEAPFDVAGQPWIIVRAALDPAALGTGEPLAMHIVEERRWERGPVSVFGVVPELDIAIAGRWLDDGPAIHAERWTDPDGASRIRLDAADDHATDDVGPAPVMRRGERLGLHSAGRFRVLRLPSFAEEASIVLDLDRPVIAWSERGELGEIGSRRRLIADGEEVEGVIRCHVL